MRNTVGIFLQFHQDLNTYLTAHLPHLFYCDVAAPASLPELTTAHISICGLNEDLRTVSHSSANGEASYFTHKCGQGL